MPPNELPDRDDEQDDDFPSFDRATDFDPFDEEKTRERVRDTMDQDGSDHAFVVRIGNRSIPITQKQIESGELPDGIPPELADSLREQLNSVRGQIEGFRQMFNSFDEAAFEAEMGEHLSDADIETLKGMMPLQALYRLKLMGGMDGMLAGSDDGAHSPDDGPVSDAEFYKKLKFVATLRAAREAGEEIPEEDVMAAMTDHEKTGALIAYLAKNNRDPREVVRERREIMHNLRLGKALLQLSEDVLSHPELVSQARVAKSALRQACSKQMIHRRRDAVRTNYHAQVIDQIAAEWDAHSVFTQGFLEAASEFRQEMMSMMMFVQSKMDQAHLFSDQLSSLVHGFLHAVETMKQRSEDFPARLKALSERLHHYHEDLALSYCNSSDSEGPAEGPRYGDSRMPRDMKGNVPTFEENLHYTAFLHAMARHIPSAKKVKKSKRKEGESDIEYDRHQLHAFRDFLRGQCDPLLVAGVSSPFFFRSFAQTIKAHHAVQTGYAEAYERAGIEETVMSGPDGASHSVMARIGRMVETSSLGSSDELKHFNPEGVLSDLEELDMTKPPTGEDESTGLDLEFRKPQNEGQRAWLKVFEKLHEHLRQQSHPEAEPLSAEEETAFIEELIRLKMDTNKKKLLKRDRLKRDRDEDNHAFRVEGGGPWSDLRLYRVPVEDGSFNDVVGSSWTRVRERVDEIYETAREAFIWTTMAPRRKLNTNMMLVGPPGMGKDMAVRAMMADPRTVGIHTTYAELTSEFVGRGSKNVIQIMDQAAELRQEHDKPVIIAIDEIDQMFPKKGSKDLVKEEMFKAMQSAMDGHTMREGVSIIGLTNNPERIPPAMWRRFNLHIIEALDPTERRRIIMKLMGGIPQEPDFHHKVAWDRILENSDHASGDVLGLIADEAYREYIKLLRKEAPDRIQAINDLVEEKRLNGETLNEKQKVQIFRRGRGKHVYLTAARFNEVAMDVLEGDNAISAMMAQQNFYETVRRKIDDGQNDRSLDGGEE